MDLLKRLIGVEAIILLGQAATYLGCELLQHNFHDVKRPIDDKVPLIPWTVYIYISWFAMIAVFPIVLFYCGGRYWSYQYAIIAGIIISEICYVVYPTTFRRDPLPDSVGGKVLKLVYRLSFKGVNCSPSMHCLQCFTVMAFALMCPTMGAAGANPGMPIWLKLFFLLQSAAIIVATQTTKQHTILDVITAIPVAIVVILFGVLVI